jgi:uncharacterized membrane protein
MKTRSIKLQRRSNPSDKCVSIASNLFLAIGTFVMLVALIYMLIRLDKADSFIAVWTPFMAAGILLSFWGILIKLIQRLKYRKYLM